MTANVTCRSSLRSSPASPPNPFYSFLPPSLPFSRPFASMSNSSQRPPLTHLRRQDLELDDAASTISSRSTSSSSSAAPPPQPVSYPLRSTCTAVAKPKASPNSVVATAGSVALEVAKHWGPRLYKQLLYPHDPQAYFQHLLEVASNYEQWSEAANILDKLQGLFFCYITLIVLPIVLPCDPHAAGKDKWKADPRSPDYDYELIATRLKQLREAGAKGDLISHAILVTWANPRFAFSFILNCIYQCFPQSNLNLVDPQLYAYTHIGTKTLIEEYIEEVVHQLNLICDTESEDFGLKQQYEFFLNVRQSFGRTALLLSGGATL
ncbi:hypothetical protein BC937DRAFT_87230, partial [Endogone sp. FLAS-F59071]